MTTATSFARVELKLKLRLKLAPPAAEAGPACTYRPDDAASSACRGASAKALEDDASLSRKLRQNAGSGNGSVHFPPMCFPCLAKAPVGSSRRKVSGTTSRLPFFQYTS